MEPTIVFFDGVCGLCNHLVDFLLRQDSKSRLQFAPLQGTTAKARLSESEVVDLDSIVVFHQGKKLKQSTALLTAVAEIGGILGVLANVAFVFPEGLRNSVYRIIAKNRYRWFGEREVCRIPTPSERSRFLD